MLKRLKSLCAAAMALMGVAALIDPLSRDAGSQMWDYEQFDSDQQRNEEWMTHQIDSRWKTAREVVMTNHSQSAWLEFKATAPGVHNEPISGTTCYIDGWDRSQDTEPRPATGIDTCNRPIDPHELNELKSHLA